ncbi:hypothetical protein NXS19_007112 [Fusarium pseudograminearum]|nr:hypothetical protein NXS19_007112 [Fusarium pseudograminearum]
MAWSRSSSTGLQRPRHLVVDTEGNLLIAESGNKGVRRVVLDGGKDLDVCIDSDKALISDANLNHGIALTADGKTILVSSPSEVYAYDYDASKGSVGSRRTVITGMDGSATHSTRTLTIPLAGNPNLLLVAGGSDGNLDTATVDKNVVRSQVECSRLMSCCRRKHPWNIAKRLYSAGDFVTVLAGQRTLPREIFGPLRTQSTIFTVETSIYMTAILVKNSIFTAFPMIPRAPSTVPTTDIQDALPSTIPQTSRSTQVEQRLASKWLLHPRERKIWDSQTRSARRSKHRGSRSVLTLLHWTSSFAMAVRHTSHFMEAGKWAIWNRNPGDGYRVSKVDFANGKPVSSSKDPKAEVPLMWNTDNTKCPSGCFRPAGLAFDKAGRLFMTSDSTGELYVLTGV